jgi:hypothetical protein
LPLAGDLGEPGLEDNEATFVVYVVVALGEAVTDATFLFTDEIFPWTFPVAWLPLTAGEDGLPLFAAPFPLGDDGFSFLRAWTIYLIVLFDALV